ncbi:rhamnogalacturonidase [Hydrotalea sandarakina]|uniref:Glycosyl hydrolase family 28 n=1 Tax=Hydrotalea sandarakina TaxID=1004304 RepID=A0A2W7RKY1_9BACT|nr:glycosyl hydrolase family 28 protein [Hydrotalea sandarakina]PZX60881.1 glycosyl hydrolase family 28 [Hydrotalea sandarakina]
MKSMKLICLAFLYLIMQCSLKAQSNNISDAIFNVKHYGAFGNGEHLDHIAINKAIDACAAAGGGTVFIPAGKYLCGSIHLKSNVHIYLSSGAVIVGANPELNVYDTAEAFPYTQYQDGGHTYFHNSLIWGEDLHDISITGSGMIDGGAITREDNEAGGNILQGSIGKADKAIALKNCKRVFIRDVTIYHGGHFAILLTGCNWVTLDNLLIDTNRDGIDIDACANVTVNNCKVNSPNDDAICPKASYALNKPVTTENVIITNCTVSAFKEGTLLDGTCIPAAVGWSGGRIKFGTESNGGFKNCIVSNCIFRYCDGLALEEVDGGEMNNIVVDNIVMDNVHHYPIYITLGNRNRGPLATTHTGTIKNIYISNVRILNADTLSGIQITGVPNQPVENIELRNITIQYKGGGSKYSAQRVFPELGKGYPEPYLLGVTPAYGLFLRNVKQMRLTNIQLQTIKPDERPVIYANNVLGLQIDGLTAPLVKGVKPAVFHQVKEISIQNAPVLQLDKVQ